MNDDLDVISRLVDYHDHISAPSVPVTEDLGRRGLALPFSGVMEEGEVDQVCREITDILH